MKTFFIAYVAAIGAFLILDGLWLGLVAKNFYAEQLSEHLRKDFLVVPAVAFYLVFTAGLVFLAVRPDQPDLSLLNIALYGAIVGMLAYGTYDMTNLATLRDWPLKVSLIDWVWGTVLSSVVAVCSAVVTRMVHSA